MSSADPMDGLLQVFEKLPSKISKRLKQKLDPSLYIRHDKTIWINDFELSQQTVHQICLTQYKNGWQCPQCIEPITDHKRLMLYGDLICKLYIYHYCKNLKYFPKELRQLIISYTPITVEIAQYFNWPRNNTEHDDLLYIRERMKDLFKKLVNDNYKPTRGKVYNLLSELVVYLAIQETVLEGWRYSNEVLMDYWTESNNKIVIE